MSVTGTLTDGTGVSTLGWRKLLKDFVADFLLTLGAAFGAGAGLEALDLGSVLETPELAGVAIATAFVKALYRVALRWAST